MVTLDKSPIPIRLQPKQAELYDSMQRIGMDAPTTLGWGGSRGAAKSGGLRRVNLLRRIGLPGTKSVIIRRVYKDVKENHIDKYLEEYPFLRGHYSVSHETITVPTAGQPSPILFRYAENLETVKRQFMGPEYYDIFVDQAEQFSEQELRVIKTSNRAPNRKQGECKMALFFNPGGIGTEYLRRIFWQKRFEGSERSQDYRFIQAYGWDNFVWFDGLGYSEKDFYALDSETRFKLFITETQYGRDLNALPPALRAGHLLGNFESFEGQYYAGVWDESRQILTAEQVDALLQPWWTCWIAIDWGFAHHACCLWFASGKVNPARFKQVFNIDIPHEVEIVVCYRELVVSETEEQELAQMIVEATPEKERPLIRQAFLSPDAWAKRGSANAIADTMADVMRRGKMPAPYPADDDRIGGWRLLYSLFRCSNGVYDPDFAQHDELLHPMLFVSGLCQSVIESVPMAQRDDKHPGRLEDVIKQPTKADDVLDTLRYGCKSMLDAQKTAPIAVQAKELWDRMPSETGDQVQKRAMAMMKFEHDKRSQNRRRASNWVRS